MLVAIEGIDGSGKGTQAKLLAENLTKIGVAVKLFSFPYYSETFFGKEVGKYLNGGFGQLDEVPAEFASLLYAGDRFEKKQAILDCFSNNEVVICDRYVASNLAHQSAKLFKGQQQKLISWIEHIEFTIFGMPVPDITFLLNLPPARSKEFVLKKKERSYTSEKLDLHEAAGGYIEKVSEAYLYLAQKEDWYTIDCEQDGGILSIDEVSRLLFEEVRKKALNLK